MPAFDAVGMDAVGANDTSSSNSVTVELSGSYFIRAAVMGDLPASYAIRSLVSSDLAGSYSVIKLANTSVSADFAGVYAIWATTSASLSGAFQIVNDASYVRAPIGSCYQKRWNAPPVRSVARRVIAPAALAVSLADARDQAKVDIDVGGTSALDAQITQAIRTYTADAEHITGRRFITQTWAETLDAFPAAIRLPGVPLASVSHVKFYDASGVQRTLDPQDYFVDDVSEPGYVVPATGCAWPATATRINAVEVQYVCGYGVDDATVPDAAKGYILAMVQQQFAPVTNAKVENIERGLDSLKVYA